MDGLTDGAQTSLLVDRQRAMKRRFKRDYGSLAGVFAFVGEFFAKEGVDRAHLATVNLVLEELFTNMVKYNTAAKDDIVISLDTGGETLDMCLIDVSPDPFDLTLAPEPDTDLPIEQRRVGGLGIHLVRQVVDDIRYEHVEGESRITLTKRLK